MPRERGRERKELQANKKNHSQYKDGKNKKVEGKEKRRKRQWMNYLKP